MAAALLQAFGLWAMGASYYGLSMLAAGVSCALFILTALPLVPAFGEFAIADPISPDAVLGKRSLRRSRRHPWLSITLGVLGLRLALYILAYAVDLQANGYNGSIFDGLMRLWLRTDAPHYLGLAKNWYVTVGDPRFHIVFFPMYPIFIRVFSYLTGGNLFASALAVSNICAIGSGILLYELFALDHERKNSLFGMALAMILPGAMFMGAPMSESLFLMLSLACAYCSRKQKYFIAALFGALAAFTRSVGVLLCALMAAEMFMAMLRDGNWKLKRIFGYIGCLFIVALGTLGYIAINYFVTGNPFTFLTYQREHWSQSLGFFWNTAAYQTNYLFNALADGDMRMALGLFMPNLVCAFGALAIMAPASRKIRPSYTFYFLFYFAISIGCSWLLSGPRYLAVCFPLAFGLEALLRKAPKWLVAIVVTVLFLGLCGYTIMYILGYPIY